MTSITKLFSLEGRRALITGCARGIGRSIAVSMAEAGARVALNDLPGDAALVELNALIDGSLALEADLGDSAQVASLARAALDGMGGVDILVLNGSVQWRQGWDQVTDDAFATQVAVNFESSIRLVEALAPGMLERGWGRILAIGSIQEVKESPVMPVYAGLKAAQTSLMRNLARQFARSGVTCNTLSPGVVETDRNTEALSDPVHREQVRNRIPMGRFAQPDDMVGAAMYLCSDAGRYTTGERILVDGGLHL